MASKRVALEIAAAWLPPDCLVPVAAASKELKALIESNSFWTDFYRRRFPCLAALPGYASPKDARGFVKALLHALPAERKHFQPEGSDFGAEPIPKVEVSVPRDAQGRAVPFSADAVLVAQLVQVELCRCSDCTYSDPSLFVAGATCNVVHATNYTASAETLDSPRLAYKPLTTIQARLADVTIHVVEGDLRRKYWQFEVSSAPIPSRTQDVLRDALSLSEAQMVVGDAPYAPGNPDAAEELLGPFKEVERRMSGELRQEVFIVSGDNIYRFDEPRWYCPEARSGRGWLRSVIYRGRESWMEGPGLSVDANFPHSNFATECRYSLGSYVARHPQEVPQDKTPFMLDHKFDDVLTLRLKASEYAWHHIGRPFCCEFYHDEATDPDGWAHRREKHPDADRRSGDAWDWFCNFMCQLLAAADPARFPR